MHRILIAAIVTMVTVMLAACSSNRRPFNLMTPEELVAYNSIVSVNDMVYCVEDVRTGSHIRKKSCATIAEISSSLENNSYNLDLVNYGGGPGIRRGPSFGVD